VEKVVQRMYANGCVTSLALLTLVTGISSDGAIKQEEIKPVKPVEVAVNREEFLKHRPSVTISRSLNVVREKEKPKKEVKKKEEWMDFTMTHYIADCEGCIGITKEGVDVSDTIYFEGRRVIAVDPRYIPLGSIVEIDDGEQVFKATAVDTGGRIKGRKIDLLVNTKAEAKKLGVKDIKVKFIRKGWDGKSNGRH
jgi:3D (Asp-Asp-Asp) domain-containing protein